MHIDVPALFDEFLITKRLKGLSETTLRTYQQRIGHFVRWLGERELDRSAIREYVKFLSTTESRSLAGIASYIRDVSAFCGWLVGEDYLPKNPTSKFRPKLPKRRPASYSKEQLHALLDGASLRDRALIIALLDTGLRAGEIVQMRRPIAADGRFTIVGKGNKERPVWLNSYALHTIQVYLASRTDDHPAVWISRIGNALTPAGVHQAIDRRAILAGIRGEVTRLIHSFRATFARCYISEGGDLESLRKLLGPESIARAAPHAQLVDDELERKKKQINPLRAIIS